MPIWSRIVSFLGGREALERKGDRIEEPWPGGGSRAGRRAEKGDGPENLRAQVEEDEARDDDEQRTSHQAVLGAQVSQEDLPLPVRSAAASLISVPRGTTALTVIGRGGRCKSGAQSNNLGAERAGV